MPLLRIESRDKSSGDKPPRKAPRSADPSSSGSAMPAILSGVLVGLVVVIGAAAFLVARSRSNVAATPGATAPITGGAMAPSVAVPAAGPLSGNESGRRLPTPEPMLDPINTDYPRESVIASVNGRPYTMGELETAVRIAKVLGSLTGDAVPDLTSPDMREFQVRMLKRQIDVLLVKQAANDAAISLPGEPVENLVSDFMTRIGGSDAQLQQLMTTYGVTQDQLNAWFEDSALVNTFVAYALVGDRDPTEREQLTTDWLSDQWAVNDIFVNFYDPEQLGIPVESTPGL